MMIRLNGAFMMVLALGLVATCSPGYILGPIRVQAAELNTTAPPEGVMMASRSGSIYQFTLNDIDGKPVPLSQFRGKTLLLVNTASFCGNTPQYSDLQAMYDRYHDRGFEILAFPANNFGRQEPGSNEEIKSFCYTKYSLTFPLFSKISVKGDDKHPLYQYLTEQSPFPGEVEWNFQKYLVDRTGNVIARYHHRTKPLSEEIVREVERSLAKN
ncbi:MAG: glutathione peroxidase [Nitrospiraceae bacterium]